MTSLQEKLQTAMQPYLVEIDRHLALRMDEAGPCSRLKEACSYALLAGGKRYRPAIVLMIAEALGKKLDVMPAALGVEFFHTASLIADDLPCMDNADERRGNPSTHKQFDEVTALLASYTLIAEAYGSIPRTVDLLKKGHPVQAAHWDHVGMLALENVTHNGGLLGITGGQYDDIDPPPLTIEIVKEVIRKKTVSLFEIAFVFGWLFGGGAITQLPLVKKGAYHFGMALQISDDLGDQEEDMAKGRQINLANVAGKKAALQMFHEEIKEYNALLQQLKMEKSPLRLIGDVLVSRVEG